MTKKAQPHQNNKSMGNGRLIFLGTKCRVSIGPQNEEHFACRSAKGTRVIGACRDAKGTGSFSPIKRDRVQAHDILFLILPP
jgi:hypothetical protein